MQLNATLRKVILSLIFILPLLSLVVAESLYFPYITGKNFLFRFLVEIIFVCFVALALRDPNYRPRWKSPILISLAVFIAVLFIADLFGENFYKSFWSNYERMEGFVTFIHLLAFFFASTVMLNSENLWKRFFHTFFAASVVIGLIGIYEHFHDHIERVSSTLGNSTYLGALMIFNIFLALFYLLRSIRQKSRDKTALVYLLLIIYDAYILYITGTRGAFLGCLAGFVFIAAALAFFEKERKIIKRAGIIILALVIAGTSFILVFRNSDFVKNNSSLSRFSAPVNAVLTGNIQKFAETEGRGRLLIWQAALQGAKERPVLGWGQENFNYIFNKYYDPRMYDQEQWFDRSHNVILDWLTQAGILGLLSYLSLFGLLIYTIWRKGSRNFSLEDKTVLSGLLIAYFIHNFFVFDNITSYFIFFSILAYVNGNQKAEEKAKHFDIHPHMANYALTPLTVVLAIFLFYFGVLNPYLANRLLIDALAFAQQSQAGDSQFILSASENFRKALSSGSFGSAETREQFLQILPQVAQANLDPQIRAATIASANEEMEKQLKETPTDARYFLFYGFTLNQSGDYAKAGGILEKARQLSPHKQTILFELGESYLFQKKYEEGVVILKEAHDSAPGYQEATVRYAAGLIYMGKNKEAEDLLSYISSKARFNPHLLRAYFNTRQYQKLIDIYRENSVDNPSDYRNYLSVAAFLLDVNDRTGAIAELQKGIDNFTKLEMDDPGYASLIDAFNSYIGEIKAGKNPMPL